MIALGSIGFITPWILIALLALPILWLLLRATPPAAIHRRFPGVVLLIGLKDADSISDRTPWWLLLLRTLAIATVIIGLAGPILNPDKNRISGTNPILILTDATWASARDWPTRINAIDNMLQGAKQDDRPVALIQLSAPEPLIFQSAETARKNLPGLRPNAWPPSKDTIDNFAKNLGEGPFETWWVSDGIDHENRADLLKALKTHGPLTVFQSHTPVFALTPPQINDGTIKITALRSISKNAHEITVQAHGRDPAGNNAILAERVLAFGAGENSANTSLTLPSEIRNRITQFQIKSVIGAGAITLTDDRLHRREIALISRRENREGLELLSPLHYLKQALLPSADLLDGPLLDILPANPDVIIMADIAEISDAEQTALLDWLKNGKLLLRFAGPRLAASDISRKSEHALMPVRLRAGGRSIGGAMSWGAPKSLAPFPKTSPFFGLNIPTDVKISSQIIAQPDPTLADRTIAQLGDGTPLVTRKSIGNGHIVLFHVTANAEWSTLPLSGLFVEMLERLAISTSNSQTTPLELSENIWQPTQVLDGFGELISGDVLPGVTGKNLANSPLGPNLYPGVYQGSEHKIARNVLAHGAPLITTTWPTNTLVKGFMPSHQTPLTGWFLAVALLLLAVDAIASLSVSGRLKGAPIAMVILAIFILPGQSRADDAKANAAAAEVALAHILTGNSQVDKIAKAGLFGLSETLFFRTSIEPIAPHSIDVETDELAFYPLLYWPITPDQPTPSAAAYEKLNRYLRAGGMILFDTRDADITGYGAASPNGRKLQQLAGPLDIPALEKLPSDHVLTRTFYLLQDFPGRYSGRDLWVEAARPDAQKDKGMPFRNLNDGVTPIVIGGNDWASAWAMDRRGKALLPVGRGLAGDRQRELAYRFGINLVMHVLTGNYKSDQVHVPALLERLGQ